MDGKDNKEDKTREEANMTLSTVFPKCSKVVQIHISGVFLLLPILWINFGPLWTLLDTLGPLLKILEKLG